MSSLPLHISDPVLTFHGDATVKKKYAHAQHTNRHDHSTFFLFVHIFLHTSIEHICRVCPRTNRAQKLNDFQHLSEIRKRNFENETALCILREDERCGTGRLENKTRLFDWTDHVTVREEERIDEKECVRGVRARDFSIIFAFLCFNSVTRIMPRRNDSKSNNRMTKTGTNRSTMSVVILPRNRISP